MNIYPKYMLFTLFCIFLIFILITNSCDSTEPKNIKSPRDYTWTTDTIYNSKNYQTIMSSIWGSSESDIYVCGHSSGHPGGLWHYNGDNWQMVDLLKEAGNISHLTQVHGSSVNNVWIAGYKKNNDGNYFPFLFQFNGVKWFVHELDINLAIYSVFVKDNDQLWFCGSNGIFGSFDINSSSWNIDTIDVENNENDVFQLTSLVIKESNLFMIGVKSTNLGETLVHYFIEVEDSSIKIKSIFTDNFVSTDFEFGSWLKVSKDNILYSHGLGGIFRYEGQNWVNIINTVESQTAFGDYGSNSIIIGDQFNGILRHFDGNNWQLLPINNINKIWWTGIWMSENKAIIIGLILNQTQQKTIILTGQ